jgi:hypothetical protein
VTQKLLTRAGQVAAGGFVDKFVADLSEAITVTGMDLPSSSKNWDMPSFFPRMPMAMGG